MFMRKGWFFVLAVVLFHSCGKDDSVDDSTTEYHKRPTGAAAKDIVSSDVYKTLVVEIQYFGAHKPTERAIGDLENFLASVVEKPNGIIVRQKQIEFEHEGSYTLDEIRGLENRKREYYPSGDTMCSYFIFLNGDYSENDENSTVLGIAHRSTSMALFQKTIQDRTGGFGKPRQDLMESTVLKHEFGHILGLVNVNDDMVHNHQDKEHGSHCNNQDCLMYWTVGSGSFVADLVGRLESPDLDENCMTDLNQHK